MIDQLLVAILSNGHVLLEGVPGVAKTITAKLLSKTLNIGFSRIQFTPDLMPSDVLGTSVFNPKEASFQFKQGPLFSNIVLIDEINRADLSSVFGELMYALEYRGEEVQVPHFGGFRIPKNVFLIGTMNTADKSLALLDVALRRRFEFRELAPDFTACADLPEEMRAVLKRLNERMELRKDRDHRIGHAFFMGVKNVGDFNRAFVRKVVPLLQEYFFNDIDGARFVLGEIGRESEPGFLRQITAASADAKYQRNRWRWFTDEQPEMDCWERLQNNLG